MTLAEANLEVLRATRALSFATEAVVSTRRRHEAALLEQHRLQARLDGARHDLDDALAATNDAPPYSRPAAVRGEPRPPAAVVRGAIAVQLEQVRA